MEIIIVRDREETEKDFRKRIELTSLTMENQHHFTEGFAGTELVEAKFEVYEEK